MRFAAAVVALLCLVVLFFGLDLVGLVDSHEARDACVVEELAAEREFLSPLYAHEPLFEKPVLAYAPDRLARLVTPGSPLAARAWRATLAMALVLGTALLGAQYFGWRAGWLAGGVLVTSVALPLAARTDGTQLLGTLLGWVGVGGLADAVFGRRPGLGFRLIVTYGALAAALLGAGPLPALWPLAGLALYLLLRRDREGARRARPVAGFLFMAGIAVPWYGAMTGLFGARFLGHVPFFPYAVDARGPWYTGPVLALSFMVVGFFPWSALLPNATLHAATWWRLGARPGFLGPRADAAAPSPAPLERERREERAAHFFIACLFAGLAPLLFYPGPPLPAALPALPAAALLCGRFLDHLFESPRRVATPLLHATLMLALAGSAAAISIALVAARVRDAGTDLRLLAALVLLAAWAPLLANLLGRRRLAAVFLALPVAAGAPLVALRVMPAMEGYLNARETAESLNAAAPPAAALVLLEPAPPSLRFYARRNLVVAPQPLAAYARFRAADGLTYTAFRPSREREVARMAPAPIEILLRTPSLVLARLHWP